MFLPSLPAMAEIFRHRFYFRHAGCQSVYLVCTRYAVIIGPFRPNLGGVMCCCGGLRYTCSRTVGASTRHDGRVLAFRCVFRLVAVSMVLEPCGGCATCSPKTNRVDDWLFRRWGMPLCAYLTLPLWAGCWNSRLLAGNLRAMFWIGGLVAGDYMVRSGENPCRSAQHLAPTICRNTLNCSLFRRVWGYRWPSLSLLRRVLLICGGAPFVGQVGLWHGNRQSLVFISVRPPWATSLAISSRGRKATVVV